MWVREEGIDEAAGAGAFAVGPTIVGAGLSHVDLFPGVLANVVDEHSTRAGLKREGVGIAQAQRPDRPVVAGRGIEEGIVGWNRTVCVDAKNLAEQVTQRLRVRCIGVLAHREVELAVWPKVNRTAIVIRRTGEIVEIKNDNFAACQRHITVGGKATDAIVNCRSSCGVVSVDKLIGRKVWVESYPEQSALAERINGETYKRRTQESAILDHAKLAPLFADKQPAIRSEGHGSWVGQASSHRSFAKACRQSGAGNQRRTREHKRDGPNKSGDYSRPP